MPVPTDEIHVDYTYTEMIIVPKWNIPKIVQAQCRVRRSADHEELVRQHMEKLMNWSAHDQLIRQLLKKPVKTFTHDMDKRVMRRKPIQSRNLRR